MLNIYCDSISPRTIYIFKLMFRDLLGLEYSLTGEPETARNNEYPVLSYSGSYQEIDPFIFRTGLLSENFITEIDIIISIWEDIPVFFQHQNKDSVFPFDPFALCFYLVSRYEEYLPDCERDSHGRYKAENSLAYRNGFLQLPLVNIIAGKIKSMLLQKYKNLKFEDRQYSFRPTYDIDMAYAHLGKGIKRTIGGFGRMLFKLHIRGIVERKLTLMRLMRDPYDNYDLQFELHKKYDLKPVYFINLGDNSRYDRNLSFTNQRLQELIKRISDIADTGIHPSYYTDDDVEKLNIEKQRLEQITDHQVVKSRQHFLKLNFPETYRSLIEIGIREDYSMGYASQPGFRAGICTPFNFYDLKSETETELMVFPFAFMDTTFQHYLKNNSREILQIIKPVVDEVKLLNGSLIGIWHNYALSNNNDKLNNYKEIVKLASEHDPLS